MKLTKEDWADYRRRWAIVLLVVVIVGALLMTPKILFFPALAVVAIVGVVALLANRSRK